MVLHWKILLACPAPLAFQNRVRILAVVRTIGTAHGQNSPAPVNGPRGFSAMRFFLVPTFFGPVFFLKKYCARPAKKNLRSLSRCLAKLFQNLSGEGGLNCKPDSMSTANFPIFVPRFVPYFFGPIFKHFLSPYLLLKGQIGSHWPPLHAHYQLLPREHCCSSKKYNCCTSRKRKKEKWKIPPLRFKNFACVPNSARLPKLVWNFPPASSHKDGPRGKFRGPP